MKRAPIDVPRLIARERDGGELSPDEIRALVHGAAQGTIPDYQMAALLMAIVFRGLSRNELSAWLDAMVSSGARLDLRSVPGRKVDKHSTGGVGDKISICLAPAVAACGVPVPMMAGRALGHTGGTLDKLEAIPGLRTSLGPREFMRVLRGAGFVLGGQSASLAPADRVLYALRDATGTVESIPLIASSILSKKIAEGTDALLMDVKVGSGAFLPTRRQALDLAHTIVGLGRRAGLDTRAFLTAMDQPLGREVGNASEVAEAVEVLRGGGPPDTRRLTVELGAEMLVMGRAARHRAAGRRAIERALASGAAFERLVRCVELQGGDARVLDHPERLPRARKHTVLRAAKAGVLARLDAGAIGRACTVLGAGRRRKEDAVDAAVGITLHHKMGARVELGEPIMTVWYNDGARLAAARRALAGAWRLAPTGTRVHPLPLIVSELT